MPDDMIDNDLLGTNDVVVGVVAALILVALVGLRGITGGKVEVKLSDAAIAIIPIVVWLLVSGRITKISLGPEGLTAERATEAIVGASEQPIEFSRLPVEVLELGAKGSLADLETLIQKETEGLTFTLGSDSYAPDVIKRYLTDLIRYPFFRYVVFNNQDGTLFGVIDGRKLAALVEQRDSSSSWEGLRGMIADDNKTELSALPGFVSSDLAIRDDADKRYALQRMEDLKTNWLPVVDGQGALVGGAERSRLTSSLVLDVTNRLLEKEKQ